MLVAIITAATRLSWDLVVLTAPLSTGTTKPELRVSPEEPMPVPGASAIEWLGDLAVRSNGRFVRPEHVLAAQASIDLCAETYPLGAAVRATLEWRAGDGEPRRAPMRLEAEHTGPSGNNARWCAAIPAPAAGVPIVARVIAEDAAGAPVEQQLAFTPRDELALWSGDPAQLAAWRMAGPGSFAAEGQALRARPGDGLGLYWATVPTPPDFELSLDWRLDRLDDNSGVFLRFRDPESFGYDNPAWVGVHDGLEVQIDDTARPDGADVHRTGAVYEQPGAFSRAPDRPPGTWRRFVIRVVGPRITVTLDGHPVSDTTFAGDPARPGRALPSAPGAPRFVGLQTHSGTPAFRDVRLRRL